MAREGHVLKFLESQLENLGEEALAGLASPGLLRRAKKDLEGLSPTVVELSDSVEVAIGTQQVRIDAGGPVHAQCTCKAKTTCHHVLAAWLHLRSVRPASVTSAKGEVKSLDLFHELDLVGVDSLISFAGLTAVREAVDSLDGDASAEILPGPPVLIRLRHPPVDLHYGGGGLDAFVLDYRGKRRSRLIVQAVLALQRASGRPRPELPAGRRSAQMPTGSARAPEQLLDHVLDTLCECTRLGVTHLSEHMAERLLSLAAAAGGAELHRLRLTLTRLAHHVDLQIGRSAATSSAKLLDELAHAYGLATAIRHAAGPVPALWGKARSDYEELGRLELIGVAAEPWSGESGYVGLTTWFWSVAHQRLYSVTQSRIPGIGGFRPTDVYRGSGPWSGCDSPAKACGSLVRLSRAKVNRNGRVSLSEETQAELAGLAKWPGFEKREFSSWRALRDSIARDRPGTGLAEDDPQSHYVVIRSDRWLTASFDQVRQELRREVVDISGDRLSVWLRYSQVSSNAIERLEGLCPPPGARLFGKAETVRGEIVLRPVALLLEETPLRADNLYLDETKVMSLTGALAGALRQFGVLESGRDASVDVSARPATSARIEAISAETLRLAERGVGGERDDGAALGRAVASARQIGLELAEIRPGEAAIDAAACVLRLRYCLTVMRQLRQL